MSSNEPEPHPAQGPGEPELVSLVPMSTAVVRGTVTFAGLRDFFDGSFKAMGAALAAQGVAVAGPAFCVYRGLPIEPLDLEIGFPTDHPMTADGDVVPASLPGGRAARLVHYGAFDALGASWERLGAWMAGQGLAGGELRWETYVTQPAPDMDPRDLRTELTWLIAA
ncbi:GyrI-like domain-containing protein [Yinghuangia seranimata]|uniref:GyrI-like domain-containing protein n=1 Tax=Yinghuangia seranimata TaxID=408067 RepID=UPI00248C3FE2|nr:GyrI-like domain-containing protein [Yinghuangia seranimata]MDI2124627.1 GyrI-like domain-containing protein [Yinghuangia seranimata]